MTLDLLVANFDYLWDKSWRKLSFSPIMLVMLLLQISGIQFFVVQVSSVQFHYLIILNSMKNVQGLKFL